jgi:hypothetical protein
MLPPFLMKFCNIFPTFNIGSLIAASTVYDSVYNSLEQQNYSTAWENCLYANDSQQIYRALP